MNIIKLARKHTGLHQGEFGELVGQLAERSNIQQARISQYESGAVHPSATIRAIVSPWAAKQLMLELRGKNRSAMESLLLEALK